MCAVAAQPRTGLTPMIPTPSLDSGPPRTDVTSTACCAGSRVIVVRGGEGDVSSVSGGGGDGVTDWCERLAPGDDLVEHGVQRRQVVVARLEDAEVLELGQQRQRDLLANVGHLQLAGDESEVLDGAGTADAAVGDEAHRLV